MKKELFVGVAVAAIALQAAFAEEPKKVVHSRTVICTTGKTQEVTCTSSTDGAAPVAVQAGDGQKVVVETDGNEGGEDGDEVNVQVIKTGQGEERRVIVVRHGGQEGADGNHDGMITRREFMARAEAHFSEIDKNHDGVLSKEEMKTSMPPIPPMPPMPPLPPLPPQPPVPPAN